CRVMLVLFLTEILWPCALFLILAVIRFQEPPKYKENCYLEARDLPSGGLYPFMRTLFCNVGSKCKNTSYATQETNCLRFTGPDLDFMKEIEELAEGFIETTEKAMALEKLWEENMGLNEAEEMISRAENLHKQPYFWNFLHSLPHLELNGFYAEDKVAAVTQFLEAIQTILTSLKGLLMTPLGPSFYEVMKTALNLTAATVFFLSGFHYNLSLWDVLWNPHAVRTELESRFGFDDLHIEKLLSYIAQLRKIPTGETLEQFACFALSRVPKDEANKENNEDDCISTWHEAKIYLIHAVSKLRLYAQVFEQWFSNNRFSQKLLLELERIIDDLMSQFLDDREVRKLFAEISTLIQQWNEKSDCTMPLCPISFGCRILHLERMKSALQNVSQWPVSKRLLLVDGAIRNVIAQYLYFTEGKAAWWLINNTFEEILFGFEGNPYWKDLKTFVSWMCEVAQYMNEKAAGTMEGQSGEERATAHHRFYSDVSLVLILTSFKEFLKREENLTISGEMEIRHLFHLVQVIEDIIMLDFSASSNQSLIENVLNSTITWMKTSGEGKESGVSELLNELRENFQPLQPFWMKEKTEVFWHIVKVVFYELGSRLSHLRQVEEEEVLEALSRIMFYITENKIHNRSILLLQHILTDWPQLNIAALNHQKHFSENFLSNLYEAGSLADHRVNASFDRIHRVSNASSLLLSNATFIYKIQKLREIVHDFFRNVQTLNSSSVASLVPVLFSLYQNEDLILNIESSNALLTVLYETLKDISSFQVWNDFQDRDQVFDLLSETFDVLWNFTSKSLCEKLLNIYNYTEFQAQSLAQKGKKDMHVVYSTLSSLKTLFMDEELQTDAFCFLEQFLDISPECLSHNDCIDFYTSDIASHDHSAEVYSLLLLSLDSVLSNITNLGDKVNVPYALHCTFTWLQTWTEIFEEASKILNLNSTFFVCLRDDLANLSESLLNATHDELCNSTAMVIVEMAKPAMKLLNIIFEGNGNLNDWKDFESFLANLQNVFNGVVDVTNSLKGNSLESVLEMMGVMITELQKSVLKVVNGEILNSWLDTLISEGSGDSKGEDRAAGAFSIGNSLSTVLKVSQKELGIILTEIKGTSAFFKSVLQGKYMVCIRIFQNITKVILDNTLKDISNLQTNFSSHLNSLLNFHSTVDETEDCKRWMHGFRNLSENYKSPSHLESAKHILFLLESLGSIETDTKLMNVMDIVNLIFNLIFPECSLTGSDVICLNIYFSIIAKPLKNIHPEFYVKDYISVLEFIFMLLNNSERQMAVNDLVGHSWYMSNKTHFIQSIHGFNRNSKMFPNSFRHDQLSSVELLAEIQTLLKNETFEVPGNSSPHLDVEIEPFLFKKNTTLLMEFFQYMISKLDSKGEHKMFLQELVETAALNIELVSKALKVFNSSSFTGFPLRDDKEFLKRMVALVQNMKNMDVEFLKSQFKQVQRSLDNFFKNVKPLYIENSELRMLTDWWNTFENNSCNWNLTGLWKITALFEQDELYDVEEMFHFLLDVISLTERLAHGNITKALTEIYAFILTQEEKMPMFTEEEFSNQVESLLMLLETLTDTSDEPAEASVCFSAAFCWSLTTATPPTFTPCDLVHTNYTFNYNAVMEVIKELKLITLEDSSSCTMEDFQMDIARNLTCFFHQIKEWNSILLQFTELHHVNGSVLKELLDFWNELSLYTIPLQVNNTYSVNCSSTPKRQMALQIIETLGSMAVAEMEMAKSVIEQLDDLYGGLSWNRRSRTSLIKTVLTNVKNMTSEVPGLLDTEAVLSFLSLIQPLMMLSSVGNQTYTMLMILSALNKNSDMSDNFENFWFPIVTSIEDLLVNFNVRHLLAVIDHEFQLLRLVTGQPSSMALDVLIQQFNTSSVTPMLRNLEDIQKIVNSFVCECNSKNYSKIIHSLILLMTNEISSNDLLLVVKDVIDFLEIFQNKSKEHYTSMLFVDGHLSREKLNYTANSVLLKNLLLIIADLAAIEEVLHANNIELQAVDFIDSFFDNTQNREVSLKNKITFLLKNLASKICEILQEHLSPPNVLLLQKLQFTILNVLKIFSEEPVVISNLFCVVTKCKDGLMGHLLLSVVEGITVIHDHYQDIERMWPAFNKGDCESMAYINQKLSNILESFLRTMQNTGNGNCECQLTLGNVQRQLQILWNLTQLRLDIGSSVNISEETTSTILEASISDSKVSYSAFVVALTGRCDEEVLSLLLKLPENSKTSLVVEELCSLPALDLYTMFVLIIQNLNIRHIFYKIKIPSEVGNALNMLLDVVSSISSLLDKAHYAMENLPVFLQRIQNTGVLDISALHPICFLILETMMNKMFNSSTSKQIDLLSQLLVNISSCVLLDRFQPFDSVEKLEEKAHELMQQNNLLASNSLLPQHISYTIRTSILYSMRTDLIKNPAWKSHPQKLPADGFKYNHIFIPLQDMIERAIISAQTGTDTSEPAIQVQAMPYPCHTSDLFLNNIGFFFPLMMMLTWMVSVAGMVRRLVYEREINLEEYMKTMGVHPAIHFFAWFLENVIVLTISSCALAIILKASGIFAYSNGFLIFLFLLDFGVTVIMLSYFWGVFFSSANIAALCASLVYMISFLPYIVLLVLQNQLSFTNQIIMCLFSTTAFGHGVFFITFFEGQETGIQWNNMHQSVAQGGYMTFEWLCWMMLFDSILYSVGGWYFSNIIPGKSGLKNRWYFPFTVSYWKNLRGAERGKRHFLNSNMIFFNENFQDKAPSIRKGCCIEEATIGVILLSLTKEHMDGQKAAIKDLSLTFHRGQITALLGPNGAGKTTIMSLLTGLYPPSSGTIIINGKDIHSDLAAIRTELGVCPQYDVLFNTLTVREHLLFYGSVKAPDWTKEQLNQQVTLEDVDLSQHQYKPVGALSGGMKRRLSIAISFIGNSKTVVLDEPTSGVDPCSRRSIWDVLLKYKAGCTLIFTTHHLDEAEVLSDHIAILQHGQLKCWGSPSYLRETYGQGHSLTLTKKPSVFEIQDPKHTAQITSFVQTHIPETFLKENSGTELTYVIPERADKTSFKSLFQALDQSLHRLHVTGYGISNTTLEEVLLVFLRNGIFLEKPEICIPPNGMLVHGAHLFLAQIVALLIKRFHHTRRDWRGTLSNVLLPVLFVALAMALFNVKPLAIDYPSLKLTPRLYDNAESFFRKNSSCWQMESMLPQDSCGCMMCPSFNTSAPYVKNKKGHVLYNLSGFLVEEYLVRPSNKARYGGWSFGRRKAFELQDKKLNNTKSRHLVKVWYNQKGFHALPSYLNEINNFILWLNLPPNVDKRQYGMTLHSQPYGGALLVEDKIMENARQCGVALCVMLGFSILTASIGSAIVKDRVSGTKRLQHISGLGYKTYWLGNFCCDMLVYMVPVTLCVGVISAFQLSAFTFRKNLAATVFLLILFGYATLPWMYLVSRFFSSSDVAFISYISLNFVFGLCTMLVTLLPRLLAIISRVQSLHNIYSILKWVFIVFPQFCLGQGLIELSYNQIKFDLTSNFGVDSYVSPFEMNFLGWIFVEMTLQGTLFLLLRLFLHWDLLQKPRGHCSSNSMVMPSEDIDVEMERQRLFGGRTGNDILLLYNLRKCYGGFKKNTAVESISLGIPRGECFGLLGTNGAGKSTTFKMLTGDIIPSAGCAVIRTPTGSEMDILSASSEGILTGYCPQQDALDEFLTGWEHLYYYCTLRGIPKHDIHKAAGDLVNRLHLNAHADQLVRTYSAGTKRKLSTALALVGKPQILLLDEPSSGMDPCSKRCLWKTILKEVQDGCAAVLTSHSMEECEALCTRLAIMINGSFKCLGSPQHIKNRFGDGYSVKVWLSKDKSYQRMILECLQLHFPGTQFKGQHLNLLEYHVPQSQGCLAELFRVLENQKTFLQIEHYSISQTTLEQV
uniref:ATP binding cassette subfamily A member 13 n=1 Tax=Amazona collaria TaxID=241587 RepID=A0A8B9J0P7_9PSIT